MNLANKRIVITRPRAQVEAFAKALRATGARPVFFPVIDVIPPEDFGPLDFAIQNLEQYNWLVLTSVQGVEAILNRLEVLGKKRIPPGLRVAAVGSKTAQFLSEQGIWIDHVPEEYIPEAMLPGFGHNLYGKRFLFPHSNLARTALADAIRCAGGLVTEVVAYRTVISEPDSAEMDDLRAGVDIITFTSPSTVQGFVATLQKNGMDPLSLPGNPLVACIGPITQQAAEEAGFSKLIVAGQYTTAGLIEALAYEEDPQTRR